LPPASKHKASDSALSTHTAKDPAAVMRSVLDADLTGVTHSGHPCSFTAPDGQVFTIAGRLNPVPGSACSLAGVTGHREIRLVSLPEPVPARLVVTT
jgi:hypothetical protein